MKAPVTNHHWMRRGLVLSVLLTGLSAAPGKAADNVAYGPEICRLAGGQYTDLGNGLTKCCLPDWGCLVCVPEGCYMECSTRFCCKMNRVPNKSTCSVVLGLVSGDLEPDDGSGDGLAGELVDLSEFADLTIDEGSDDGTIGDVGELGALPVIDGADFSMDATQGSIIIVSGRIGVVMEDGAVLVPVDPPAPDSMLGQIELMLSSMEQDPAELDNLDESETDSVGADEEDSGHGRDSVEGAPDGGTAPEAPAEDARIRRISRRGRGRQ